MAGYVRVGVWETVGRVCGGGCGWRGERVGPLNLKAEATQLTKHIPHSHIKRKLSTFLLLLRRCEAKCYVAAYLPK